MGCANDYPLKLFEDLESLKGDKFELRHHTRTMLKLLWQNWDVEWPDSVFDTRFLSLLWEKQHIIPTLYKALLVERDPFVLRAMREEIQAMLMRLNKLLVENPPREEAHKQKVLLALHNMLSIYSMFSPSPHETISVPQFIGACWQLVEYKIEPIELTPTSGFMVAFLNDEDRLFSYGLTPINHKASPILVSCGTGWPTAQGAVTQILADFWPNKTPGEIYLDWSRDKITNWLRKQKQKAILCGQSLGGALSMLIAMDKENIPLVDKAYCLNPPGLYSDYKDHPYLSEWDTHSEDELPEVHIQAQEHDPISQFGVFKRHFDMKTVKTGEAAPCSTSEMLQRGFGAHAKSYANCDKVLFESVDIEGENSSLSRHYLNLHLYNRARWFIFYFQIAPYFFIYRPLKQWLASNADVIVPFICLLGFFLLTGGIGTVGATTFIATKSILFNTVLGSLAIAKALSSIVVHTYDLFLNQQTRLRGYISTLYHRGMILGALSLIYDLTNVLSMGILHMAVLTLKRVFISFPNCFIQSFQKPAEIHTKAFHEQTNNLDDYTPPGTVTKIQAISLVALFYITVFPIKIVCYHLPRLLLVELPKKLFGLCFSSADDTDEITAKSSPSDTTSTPSTPKHSPTNPPPVEHLSETVLFIPESPSHSPRP